MSSYQSISELRIESIPSEATSDIKKSSRGSLMENLNGLLGTLIHVNGEPKGLLKNIDSSGKVFLEARTSAHAGGIGLKFT